MVITPVKHFADLPPLFDGADVISSQNVTHVASTHSANVHVD